MSSAGAEPRRSPYVGLVPYDENDAAFFFGRSRESAIVAMNLRTAKLTLLYGPSGVGKSSLLMAGAVHRLRTDPQRAEDESRFAVCVFRSWPDDPAAGLQEAARSALQELAGAAPLPPAGETLAATLREWTREGVTLLVVLDQFEEYFAYHPDERAGVRLTGFAAEFARIVNDLRLDVHVLLSIREDALASLDFFKGHVPALFANYIRVNHLDEVAAREAIEQPISAWNATLPEGEQPFAIEPKLVTTVLEATAGGGLTLTAGADGPEQVAPAGKRIEAPFLQLVLDKLWRDTVADGERTLTLARYQALGEAKRIVESHLLDALGRLTPKQQDTASACFRFLVRRKSKIAQALSDLAKWTERTEPEVASVLDKLCEAESGRILRRIAPAEEGESASYELFHDILAEPVLAWSTEHEQQRAREAERRRQAAARRRLLGVVAVLGAIALGFAGLAFWALDERTTASHATSSATSLALSSASADQLRREHLDTALLLGLEAYREKPTLQATQSVLTALEAAPQTIFRAGPAPIKGAALSPDGRVLAAVGDDGLVRLWDARTHEPIGEPLDGNQGQLTGLAFSRDGKTLVTAGDAGTIVLWDVPGGSEIERLTGLPPIGAVATGPGHMLAAGGAGGALMLWTDWRRKRPSWSTPRRRQATEITGIAFSPDGRTLVASSRGSLLLRWDARTGRQRGSNLTTNLFLARQVRNLYGVAFSPDGRYVAAAANDGLVWVFDFRRQAWSRLQGGSGPVHDVAFSRDGRTLAAAGDDGTLRLWNWSSAASGPPNLELPARMGPLDTVAFAGSRTLVVGTSNGVVLVFDVATHPRLGRLLDPGRGEVDGVAFAADCCGASGAVLASAGQDGAVELWDTDTGTRLGLPLRGKQGPLNGVVFSPDGSSLAAAGQAGGVPLWDVRGQPRVEPSSTLAGTEGVDVSAVAFSPDGHTLATGSGDGKVRLWDVRKPDDEPDPLDGAQQAVTSVAFSPDGDTVAAGGNDGSVLTWDTHEPGKPATIREPASATQAVAFSPDGHTLAAGGDDGVVQLWDAGSGGRRGTIQTSGTVASIAFSPDGRMLAAGLNEGTVELWDVRTDPPAQLGQALAAGDQVHSVAFSPDGRFLAAGTNTGTVIWQGVLWHDRDDLRSEVCSTVAGNLSQDEWSAIVPGISYRTICPS